MSEKKAVRRINRPITKTNISEKTQETIQTNPSNITQKTYKRALEENQLDRDYISEKIRRLTSRIEANLESPNQEMIGVFGIESDTVVNEALKEVETPYKLLGRFSTDDNPDVYKLFASRVFNYAKNIGNLTQSEKNRILQLLTKFDTDTGENPYIGSLDSLMRLATKTFRNVYCKECLELLKEIEENRNTKYILVVEVGLGGFNYDVLQKLININSSDLLIIIHSLRPLWYEDGILGKSVGIDSTSKGLVSRYLAPANIIFCDDAIEEKGD